MKVYGPGTRAAELRALAPAAPGLEAEVRAIIKEVRRGGDAAVARLTERFDGSEPDRLRVEAREIDDALATLDADVLAGLRAAIANVELVARAGLRESVAVDLPEGQRVELAEHPVGRVGAYVPGGRAAYPSSVVMCVVTARESGVEQVAVCAPPGPGGEAHPAILAACALCGVSEVYRMGGAQAIAALALGTETVAPVDVIVGPGSQWVQEAKRQLSGSVVGIDGVAGPSELVILAGAGADPELAALDLIAQGEHGSDGLLVAISPDRALLEEIGAAAEGLLPGRDSFAGAPIALVHAAGLDQALELAEALAPEHLQLVGDEAEGLAPRVTRAGCLFVGRDGATAFGDYVAGSNHVLPTGGAARFASALGPTTFRRRMATVTLGEGAAARLASVGAPLARAEGFPVHAESMERRS